jgi:hypothetical protein
MPVPRQADPHTDVDATNDPTLMAVCCMGAGHPRTVGGFRYLYVAIDKFTKWLEATLVFKINKQSAVKFIICMFGVPNRIITDNGS